MQFQQNDIIKDGDYYRIIFGVDGNRVSVSDSGWRTMINGDHAVYSFPLSETKNWVIVERDGKPFVEKPWKPQKGELYWIANGSVRELAYLSRWMGGTDDYYRLEQNLIFRTAAEAKECAQKMLSAIKK